MHCRKCRPFIDDIVERVQWGLGGGLGGWGGFGVGYKHFIVLLLLSL